MLSKTLTKNTGPDVAGYNVYRSTSASGTYAKINTSNVTTNSYTDSGLTNGTTYYYKITAVDTANNESLKSTAISATPNPTKVWITSITPSEIDPLGFDEDPNNDEAKINYRVQGRWKSVKLEIKNQAGGLVFETTKSEPDPLGASGTVDATFSWEGMTTLGEGGIVDEGDYYVTVTAIKYDGTLIATNVITDETVVSAKLRGEKPSVSGYLGSAEIFVKNIVSGTAKIVHNFLGGFYAGADYQPGSLPAFIGDIVAGYIVYGDVRDVYLYVRYDKDGLILGFSIVGILSTFQPWDVAPSVVKSFFKTILNTKTAKIITELFQDAGTYSAKKFIVKEIGRPIQKFGREFVDKLDNLARINGGDYLKTFLKDKGEIGINWVKKMLDIIPKKVWKAGNLDSHYIDYKDEFIYLFGRTPTKSEYEALSKEVIENGKKIIYKHKVSPDILLDRSGFFYEKQGKVIFTAIDEAGETVTCFVPTAGWNYVKSDVFQWAFKLDDF